MGQGQYRLLVCVVGLIACKRGADRPAPQPPAADAPHVLGATPRAMAADAAVAARAADAGVPLPGSPAAAKAQALAAARNAGILGALSKQNGRAFKALVGSGGFSSGMDDKDIQGGLVGLDPGGGSFGGLGAGSGGGGAGGGGADLATGRYGVLGHGSGAPSGYGIGGGGRHPTHAKVTLGAISGAPDPGAAIRGEVARRLPQLQYCYEKQLLAKPALEGTVLIAFIVPDSGGVDAVSAHDVDPELDACVVSVIKSIAFAAPSTRRRLAVVLPLILKLGA